MSLTKFTENLNIIQSLPDSPALGADELKQKFDEGNNLLKTYINDTLTKEIDSLVKTIEENVKNQLIEDNKKKYYVGKIILDTKNINPSTYLGFGVWQLWGSGRVPVGVDTADSNFNSVEKTGGSNTASIAHTHSISGNTGSHKLTISEMPSHNHGLPELYALAPKGGNQEYGSGGGKSTMIPTNYTGGNQGHSHTISLTSASGGGNINIMQKYITCYMWKRIS